MSDRSTNASGFELDARRGSVASESLDPGTTVDDIFTTTGVGTSSAVLGLRDGWTTDFGGATTSVDDFNTLTELTSLEDADEMVIYDDSASVYKKVGIDTLRQLTPPTMIVEDQKPGDTSSGTFSSEAWRTRDLNTVELNEITGASLSSNQITLPAGTYEVSFSAPAYKVRKHMAVFENITDSITEIYGESCYSSSAEDDPNVSRGFGRVVIDASKTFELQHQCQSSQSTYGFGVDVGGSFTIAHETYSRVVIKKVS